ncbi:MAG: hypothetical protein WC540_12710, partial [Sulfuritalea sp.]
GIATLTQRVGAGGTARRDSLRAGAGKIYRLAVATYHAFEFPRIEVSMVSFQVACPQNGIPGMQIISQWRAGS